MRERLFKELRAFSELARVVANEPFAVDRILDRVCDELRGAFGFSRAMAVRLNAEDDTVHAIVQQGISWPGDQWLLLERFPFLDEARRTGKASFVRDAQEEGAMPRKIAALFDVRSIVAVPLCIEDTCFGFIVGDREGARFDLDEEELEILTALGRISAVFLAKADEYGALEESVEELRQLDAAKRDFISIASHELRTPIAVVHGITSTLHLRGNELRDEQLVELRSTLFAQTTRVTELVDQLLDLSRLESGAVVIRPERFRPRQRLDGLLPQLVPDRLGDITVEIEPELELFTDPHAVDRVVSNLVLNALRYGEPPVCVRNLTNGKVRLIVEDCGQGVEPDFVPRMFERFSRSVASHAISERGAGLGLSIARSYAEALGGDLTYEPVEPTGARFALVLPLELAAPDPAAVP
jgi:signal transduction histidine kinase